MVVAPRPDIIGAIIAQLRASTDLAALVSTRISGQWQDAWVDPATGKPRSSVLIRAAGGPAGKRQINLMRSRVDVSFYGSTGFAAMQIWAMLDAVFCPGQERTVGFRRSVNGVLCSVGSVDPDGMPLSDVEEDTGWPRVVCSYIVTWMGVPG